MFRPLLIVVAFGLLLLFPAWEAATHWLPDPPLDEKRLPVPEPDWHASPNLKSYLLGWQDRFNDRYAGRNLLIRLKTQIDFSVFSHADRIYIGRDGWLFYRSTLDGKVAMDAVIPQVIDGFVAQVRTLREWLAARGIHLVIIDNQLKDAFYPEMLPASAPRVPSPSHYDEVLRRLRKETGAIVVDTNGILRDLKRERPIFHRTDFHWNDPAAFAVAKDAVDRMAASVGKPSLGWHHRLEIELGPNSGGEAAFMPLLRPATEQSLFVRKNWTDATADMWNYRAPFETIRRMCNPHPPVLPTVVVMGDSFFDGIVRCGFAEHFAAVYRARIYAATLQQVLENLPPDTGFVVVQFIETEIPTMAAPLDFKALDRARPAAAWRRP